MSQQNPKITVNYASNAVIATLTDERILEETDVQALESSILPLIDSQGPTNLVIDFSQVKFLSSAVLGLLIRVSKKIYESNGQLRLSGIEPNILQIFKITRLDKIFDIRQDQTEAVQSFD